MYPGLYAEKSPDKPAVVLSPAGERIDYRTLEARSRQFARVLRARGLRPGDTVAILAENHVRYLEVYWAVIRSGLYLTAVNWHLTAPEAAYLLNDSAARVLVTTTRFTDLAREVAGLSPTCAAVFLLDGAAAGFESYEDAVAAQPDTPLADQPAGEVMLYSSGTTGRPKGIRRALSGLQVDEPGRISASRMGRALLGIGEDSVYLTPAPLYHAAGLQWSAAAHELGATLVVMERFDAEQLMAVIERERVTHVQVVPTMMVRLLKLPADVRARYDLSSLRSLVHAAAPCPPAVKRQMISWLGPIVDEYYSSTEGSGMTFIRAADWLEHPGSVGRPTVGIPHVCAEDGAELPTGEPGLLYFDRDTALFEYHNDPQKTREGRHPAHPTWTTSGDMGYLDADGYLYLTDRKSFTIISGGVNIYPAEIEAVLILHPAVADVAVFGLPHDEMGEYVHAVVQPAAGVEPTPELAERLLAFAGEQLARFKVPRVVTFREELPRMPTGKLAKTALRQEYLAAAADASTPSRA
ncbi:acyl-CoA synthetase [Pseudofrankia inefficax]|uniref:AMP-dependent synthetase and ligase n=1 Tax=Pseudofrankia inefficax (strain DSM 45817 / CECT 9037 / DDB 130130 / EuI1c) TaxID=298654 RepID=E3J2N4_PSEI1|nr:acyl-CoA synthetase [Pseudofrankia inefficax]ADP80548.1 AMP-dependent synthetase and ligase [Pseudofrankia inefficax]